MAKLTGKKINACVFISGKGSNLNSIIKNSRDYNFPLVIKLVISNNKNADGLKYAKKYGINYKFFSSKKYQNFEKSCLKVLKEENIKFLCLAGFMRKLSKNFINNFKYQIINIHPSLLPKYQGLNTHLRALKSNDKYTGCTVHYVNEKIDSGKKILQKKIIINNKDNEETLKRKVLILEHKLYSEAIRLLFRY